MDSILIDFIDRFRTSFIPPMPSRGQRGTSWLVSKVWSDHMKGWLPTHYGTETEVPLPERRRLDAALWRPETERPAIMDIALEWEWDTNKVESDFPFGDFRKLFEVDAQCGMAIIQTRIDGGRGLRQANETLQRLRSRYADYRRNSRSVAVIEARRVKCNRASVEFDWLIHDFAGTTVESLGRRAYPEEVPARHYD